MPIQQNVSKIGIPQGTPISAVMSNIYMTEVDLALINYTNNINSLYRRYSDDIFLVVPVNHEKEAQDKVIEVIQNAKLCLNVEKTDINIINNLKDVKYQYLGFLIDKDGALIRNSSLSRQGRKLKYGIKKVTKEGRAAISMGKASKIYTKRLRKRFVDTQGRNFPNYSRRAASVFKSKRLMRQAYRLEKRADKNIRDL